MNIKPIITVLSMFKKLQKRQNMKSIDMEDIKKTEFLEMELQYLSKNYKVRHSDTTSWDDGVRKNERNKLMNHSKNSSAYFM